jgi:dCTP deaminase
MYLGHTAEIIGSKEYAMSLIGRSSLGRYGLFLQVSANLGHTCSAHKWTLELVATKAIKIYPGMKIGQVSFWKNFGKVKKYEGKYGHLNHPQESFTPFLI